jgi:hypothetical protein
MANYLKLDQNGCTVEDKIFRKYSYNSTVSVNGVVMTDPVTGKPLLLPDPMFVQVAPIQAVNPPPVSLNPGLEFSSAAWTVGPTQAISTTIDYIVEVPQGAPLIKDASLLLRGTAVNGGSITDEETVFSTLLTPNSNILTAFCDGTQAAPCVAPGNPALPQPMLFQSVQFNVPVDLVEVHNVLTISCNANVNCMATVSGLENRFSEVPGPSAMALLVIGFVRLTLSRYRQARRATRGTG